jgi:CubicO group peptidase (beta-lactamase class C family)
MRVIRSYVGFIVCMYCFISCCNTNNSKAAPQPDNKQPYGKVEINYADTTTPEYRNMIYKLDTFYMNQVKIGFNGSVLIGYKGKILYERYFGYSQYETGLKWDKNTQSQLASTSKTLTSGAILLLKDKGLLKLEDYVTKFIPDFPYPDITIRTLLNHRSGLPDYIHFASKSPIKEFLSNDDIVDLFITKHPALQFKTNTRFRYSNSNYALLATIVEKISGMKFKYFMDRFVFTPLGMNNTFCMDPMDGKPSTTSNCYNRSWKLEPEMHLDGVFGDKGVYSCVKDMYKWDQALYKGKFLKPETLKEAFSPYSFESNGVKNYGLGWRMFLYPDGTQIVFHNGYWHGNNTCFYRFIQDNFTIIVLGNKFTKSIYHQPLGIYNIIKGANSAMSNDFDAEE